MRTNDIRRVIDASLSGVKLTPQQRRELAEHAMRPEGATPPRRKIPRRLLIAAIIALLTLAAIVVPAVGGSLRQTGIELAEDSVQLHIERAQDAPGALPGASFPAAVAATWGEEFCDLLSSLGAQVLLPAWMPEGYRFESLNRDLLEIGKLDAWYENDGGGLLLISVSVIGDGSLSWSSAVESDPDSVETWEFGGIAYTYSRNNESCAVAWMENNCAVTISAPVGREEMRRMIESIYE